MATTSVPSAAVQQQLERILSSPAFARSRRLSQFLRVTVELTVAGRAGEIKEHRIGSEVFERGSAFDPQIDTIVRTQAHRLRAALSAYYETGGRSDPVVIEFSRGSYVPVIREHGPEPAPVPAAPPAPVSRLPRMAVSAAALSVAFVLGALCVKWLAPARAPQDLPAHVALPLFAQGVLNVGLGPAVVSPSGAQVVFPVFENSGKRRLWLRSLRSLNAIGLAGTEDGFQPFWSPDEAEFGFFANGMLKVFRLSDSSVRDVCEAPLGRGGSWSRDGVILFTPRAADGRVYRTTAIGGTPVAVTSLDEKRAERSHRWPEFVGDGRHFVYAAHSRVKANEGIFLGSLDGEVPVRLETAMSQARYARTRDGDYLLYVKDKAIRARRLNVSTRRLEGTEDTLANGVYYSPSSGASFTVAGGRYLVYQTTRNQETVPVQLDRAGRVIRELAARGHYDALVVSRDGRMLAMESAPTDQDESDIWAAPIDKLAFLRVTLDGGGQSVWNRGSRSLTFVSPGDGYTTIWNKSLAEGERRTVVWKSKYSMFPTDISPDGRFLAFSINSPETEMDLWLLPLDPDSGRVAGEAVAVRRSRFNEGHGYFSPDGHHLAYFSDESGRQEVYVETLPPGQSTHSRRWKVSAGGGAHPRWRSDGRELFYLSPDRSMMSVAVTNTGSSPEFGPPRKLFSPKSFPAGEQRSPYGVAADGNSIYSLVGDGGSGLTQVSLITGWSGLLGQHPQ